MRLPPMTEDERRWLHPEPPFTEVMLPQDAELALAWDAIERNPRGWLSDEAMLNEIEVVMCFDSTPLSSWGRSCMSGMISKYVAFGAPLRDVALLAVQLYPRIKRLQP